MYAARAHALHQHAQTHTCTLPYMRIHKEARARLNTYIHTATPINIHSYIHTHLHTQIGIRTHILFVSHGQWFFVSHIQASNLAESPTSWIWAFLHDLFQSKRFWQEHDVDDITTVLLTLAPSRLIMSPFPILGDAKFDPVVKVMSIRYLHHKGPFFLLYRQE